MSSATQAAEGIIIFIKKKKKTRAACVHTYQLGQCDMWDDTLVFTC